jgi:hypothetical protein
MEEKFIYEYQSLSMKVRHSIPRDLENEKKCQTCQKYKK